MAIESASARPRSFPYIFRRSASGARGRRDARAQSEARLASLAPHIAVAGETARDVPAHVVVTSGADAGQHLIIGDAPLILGARGKRNGQARVTRDGAAFVLRQIDASAGATVNGEPLGARAFVLAPGDEIIVDGEELRFECEGAARPRAAAPSPRTGGAVRRALPGVAAALGIVAVAFAAAGGYLFVDSREAGAPARDASAPGRVTREAGVSATLRQPQIAAVHSGTGRADVPASTGAFELRVTVTAPADVNWFWCFDDDPPLGDAGGRYCRARVPADGTTVAVTHDVRIVPPTDGRAFVDLYCSGACTWQAEAEAVRR